MARYFSEREGHAVPRDSDVISDAARDGIRALIRASVGTNSFGLSFPVRCKHCQESEIINVDENSFWDALGAIVPQLEGWPRQGYLDRQKREDPLVTLLILDAIEFCWKHIAKPRMVDSSRPINRFGDFLSQIERRDHVHLRFDQAAGRAEFRSKIEEIFRRNGIAYTLTENGRIERQLPPELGSVTTREEFHTGDDELDRLLATARTKFLAPDLEVRREALEALWDAWERLKTTWPGSDKKSQAKAMLDAAAGSDASKFREALEKEATDLTSMGNSLGIRHSETTQERLAASEHVDYLFQRMFSLVWMVLRTQKMVGAEI